MDPMNGRTSVLGLGVALTVWSTGCAPRHGAGDGMSAVMASKLRHAQDAMLAVVSADFPETERSALALRSISADAMTLPQDTVSYAVLAEQFRENADTLAERARARDLDGVTDAYLELTRNCVNCHIRVNRERLLGDFPDKVSQRRAEPLDTLTEPGSCPAAP